VCGKEHGLGSNNKRSDGWVVRALKRDMTKTG
jgi:hypothetical protein